jgi:hypothetical protein
MPVQCYFWSLIVDQETRGCIEVSEYRAVSAVWKQLYPEHRTLSVDYMQDVSKLTGDESISSLTITEQSPLIFFVKSDPQTKFRVYVHVQPRRERNEIRTLYVPSGSSLESLLKELDPDADYPHAVFRVGNKPILSHKLVRNVPTTIHEPLYCYLLKPGPDPPDEPCRVVIRGETKFPNASQLVECGFAPALVDEALEVTNGHTQQAAEYCLCDPRGRYRGDFIEENKDDPSSIELFGKVAEAIRTNPAFQDALDCSKELLIYRGVDAPILRLNNARWIRYQGIHPQPIDPDQQRRYEEFQRQQQQPVQSSPAQPVLPPQPPQKDLPPMSQELSAFRNVLVQLNSKGMVSSDLPELIRMKVDPPVELVEAVDTYLKCGRDINRTKKALEDKRKPPPGSGV